MRELIVAESAGFCFGVRRSVELAEGLIRQKGRWASSSTTRTWSAPWSRRACA